jgi:hypothetical protein
VERAGDAVHAGVVHLLQGDDVRVAQAVTPQNLDGAVEPAGQLDVEGDDADLGDGPGIGWLGGVLAGEPGRGRVEQVDRARAAGDRCGDADGQQEAPDEIR